ncbi:MAG: hypothetical protein DMG07_27275 [Acidobacteria bacterium]|nr:MAG: hypothetical protein DMG07_27275 [Acidobacteriota bacterium]
MTLGSKNPERFKALLHPKCLACMTAQNQEFYDSVFSRQSKDTVPANYKTTVEPIAANQGLLFENELVYPLRPSHELQIHFKTENTKAFSSTTLVVFVVYDAGRWQQVLPCPGPDTIAKMRVHKEESAKQDRRAQQLAANLSDPLRAELMDLLRNGQRVDAMKRYAAASGGTMTSMAGAEAEIEEIVNRETRAWDTEDCGGALTRWRTTGSAGRARSTRRSAASGG